MKQKSVRFSNESNEWYTESVYIEAARRTMGRIDLDPASCEEANRTVRASHFYTKEANGLDNTWHGCIWLNPPYGTTNNRSNTGIWISKLLREYYAGNIEQAVLLVNAQPDTRWFHQLFAFPICFTEGRVNFHSPKHHIDTAFSRPGSGPTHGSAFAYLGPNEQVFIDTFQQFGTIVKRVSTPKPKPIMLDLWQSA
jgi:phage N-6-adenine-methyltransferase